MIRRRKMLLVAAGFAVAVLCLSLIPLPVRQLDRNDAVRQALAALTSRSRVLIAQEHHNLGHVRTTWKYIPLYDSQWLGTSKLFYRNSTGVSDDVFGEFGLEPLPAECSAGRPPTSDFYQHHAVVEVTLKDIAGRETGPLHFNYYHGMLAAQGYKLCLVRALMKVFVVYQFEWVS